MGLWINRRDRGSIRGGRGRTFTTDGFHPRVLVHQRFLFLAALIDKGNTGSYQGLEGLPVGLEEPGED